MATDEAMEARRALFDKSTYAFIEIDLQSGLITWCNSAMSSIIKGKRFDLIDTSVYAYIADDFKAKLTDSLNKIKEGYSVRKSMWPIVKSDKATWVSATLDSVKDNYIMVRCDVLHSTRSPSPEYSLAKLIAECRLTITEVEISLSQITEDIRDDVISMQRSLRELEKDLELTASAAKLSADAAIANRKAAQDLQENVSNAISKQTEEITKLVASDVLHDQRLKIFEDVVNKKTREAIDMIESRAKEHSQIGRGIVIPVGTATAASAILQWFLDHFVK